MSLFEFESERMTWTDIEKCLDIIRIQHADDVTMARWFELFEALPPATQHAVLTKSIESQHPWIATREYMDYCAEHPTEWTALWKNLQQQEWQDPHLVLLFLDRFPWADTGDMRLAPLDVLDFLERHPALIPEVTPSILRGGQHCQNQHVYFERALQMLSAPRHRLMLHIEMQQSPSWKLLRATADGNMHLALPLLLLTYRTLPSTMREQSECGDVFALLFSKSALAFDNGFCISLMSEIVENEPRGAMSRALALGALVYLGGEPSVWSNSQIEGCMKVFHQDPTCRDGFMNILRQIVPDMEGFLQAADGLGLPRHTTWIQGLVLMNQHQSNANTLTSSPYESLLDVNDARI